MGFRALLVCFFGLVPAVFATYRYYTNTNAFGSGDTILSAYHGHGGTRSPNRKWNIECMDGEAMVGIHDWIDDFEKLQTIWCKFMFPYKPPSQGVYPYYPTCHYRDFGILVNQMFCFDAKNASLTINTFITALWDDEFQFWVYRPGSGPIVGDDRQPFKCCKTPNGYYIDYVSCYYMPTHDVNWEYYDNPSHVIVACTTGFLMTGISKRLNPWTAELHIEWIQCCRLGYGPAVYQPSPVIDSSATANYQGRTAYYAAATPRAAPMVIPEGYLAQYRTLAPKKSLPQNRTKRSVDDDEPVRDCDENYSLRYAGKGIPGAFRRGTGQVSRSHLSAGVSA
ncbi:hypothetical protein BV898_16114 [Hypsibius exemplaris]|uniref:Uncharacterized protein n=1 Tax=Hypsibius exemplaris TaxID=2072580 RepID=A0A9X6NF84_HYPEX|nr:hypothetical protein BV898_16114 [Hypsibius exemplaris]